MMEVRVKRLSLLTLVLVALASSILVTGCGSVPFLSPPPTATSVPTATSIPTIAPTATPAPPTATATKAATATPTNPPTPANPSASLGQIFKAWGTVKSFKANMVSTGLPTGSVQMTMEVLTPDKFHVTTSGLEMIMIGKTIYMKIGGKWQKVASSTIDLSLIDPSKYAAGQVTTSDVKFVGMDVVAGTPTLVFTYKSTVKGPPAVTSNNKIWVGATDSLPRKMESSPKAGQLTTITYTDYNSDISIKVPI